MHNKVRVMMSVCQIVVIKPSTNHNINHIHEQQNQFTARGKGCHREEPPKPKMQFMQNYQELSPL